MGTILLIIGFFALYYYFDIKGFFDTVEPIDDIDDIDKIDLLNR